MARTSRFNAPGNFAICTVAAESDTTVTYGGADDTWGAALTPAMLNHSGSGVVIRGWTDGQEEFFNVGWIKMKVYYTEGPAPAVLGTPHLNSAVFPSRLAPPSAPVSFFCKERPSRASSRAMREHGKRRT